MLLFVLPTLAFTQSDLSLEEAIRKGLENNYQVQLIKTNIEIAETQNSWGMAGMSPTFSLNATNLANLTDNSNNPASFFPGVVLSDNFSPSIDMSWTLFSGFGVRINKQRFEQMEEQTKGNAIVVIESTVYEIIMAYYTAVVQEEKIEIVQELLDYSTDKWNYFELRSEVGVGNSMDVLQFKNLMLSDSSNLLNQDLARKNALRNLNLLMGEEVEKEYKLTDDLKSDLPDISYDELRSFMMQNNQNIKNQYINVTLQELNRDSQKSFLYPVVSLSLGASPSFGYIELFGDNAFSTSTSSANYYGTISARYTLFNGFQRKRNVQIAKLQTEMAVLELDELKLQLSHNLMGIYDLFQTRSQLKKIAGNLVRNNSQMWEYGKDQYDESQINIFDLNDIRISYLQAELSSIDRNFELLQTYYDLYRLSGKLAQEFKISEELNK